MKKKKKTRGEFGVNLMIRKKKMKIMSLRLRAIYHSSTSVLHEIGKVKNIINSTLYIYIGHVCYEFD